MSDVTDRAQKCLAISHVIARSGFENPGGGEPEPSVRVAGKGLTPHCDGIATVYRSLGTSDSLLAPRTKCKATVESSAGIQTVKLMNPTTVSD